MKSQDDAPSPAEVVWRMSLRPLGKPKLVPVTLSWGPDDPLAVRLEFPAAGIEWVVSRDLLAAGTLGPAGLGDVALLPDLEDPEWLELILSSPDGVVGLHLPSAELSDFLLETWRVVPPGAERPPVFGDLATGMGN